jgi:hypothetical protein
MIYSMLDAFLGFGSRRLEPSLEGAGLTIPPIETLAFFAKKH